MSNWWEEIRKRNDAVTIIVNDNNSLKKKTKKLRCRKGVVRKRHSIRGSNNAEYSIEKEGRVDHSFNVSIIASVRQRLNKNKAMHTSMKLM